MTDWLEISRGEAPLVVAFPHTGTELPDAINAQLRSPWLARQDTDYFVHRLYDFAHELGATTLRTRLSRSVIDVNRDPSGASLYPGQISTALCPLTTFEDEALYPAGRQPDAAEIARRRVSYFEPYHAALSGELDRLRASHPAVVLFDAHSIRSQLPLLFPGVLPQLNLGTYDGRSCSPELTAALGRLCARSGFSWVTNGRWKGGWTTRHYGQPERGVHAVQMELAFRSYLTEPVPPLDEHNWPPAYDPARAEPLRGVLRTILNACVDFAHGAARSQR